MAKVTVKTLGGTPMEKTAETVGELKRLLGFTNYTATVNKEAQDDSYRLEDDDYVVLTQNVKGGCL